MGKTYDLEDSILYRIEGKEQKQRQEDGEYSQEKTIELLEMQLRNEKLKNNNLSSLFKAGNGITSVED